MQNEHPDDAAQFSETAQDPLGGSRKQYDRATRGVICHGLGPQPDCLGKKVIFDPSHGLIAVLWLLSLELLRRSTTPPVRARTAGSPIDALALLTLSGDAGQDGTS